MPTALEYERRITCYDWDELLMLWNQIQLGDTPDWESGKAMEYLVLRAFHLEGAEVIYPYSVVIEEEELEQIDGAIYSNGLACLIECKDVAERVNIEPLAKM